MKRGAWHQLGWNHHLMALEQLEHQAGVGVILSPRDLKLPRAADCAAKYREQNASVLLDPQWHLPSYSNDRLNTYPTSELRASLTTLASMGEGAFRKLTTALVDENRDLGTSAVVAPAVMYQAARQDIVELNAKLHSAAQAAAAQLDIPCYATVFLGESVTANLGVVESVLAHATSLLADGWYFAFEFPEERIPSDRTYVVNCLRACLLLAMTGKPVMHAYAGPMGILSMASGCTAAACGADQKQWRLCPERWQEADEEGGGGNAPARYFSWHLWGTIIYPDELIRLGDDLISRIVHESAFVSVPLPTPLNKAVAKKHNLYTMCKGIQYAAVPETVAESKQSVSAILDSAIELHSEIEAKLTLKDAAAAYQANWKGALDAVWEDHLSDFEFLGLMNG